MNTRVVVTGMGAITPIGNSVEAFWTAVKSNTVGIAPITHFDTADFKCKLAAEVKDLIQSSIWIRKLHVVWKHSASLQ